jgi:cyclic 2,3-diphosphoglycerate synthase
VARARVLALVDGEHYPPTTRWALATARAEGLEVVACLLVGGTEKLPAKGGLEVGVPVDPVGDDLAASLRDALRRHRPDAVLDLSDEPVLGEPERAVVAAVTLAAGLRYLGPDFVIEPPFRTDPPEVPTMAVIGTGKRTGKTAVSGEAARVAARLGRDPVVVAMGRGGPPAPQVAEAGSIGIDQLVDLAAGGDHAASDYLEDAVTTGVTTIGARRAGGGLFGRPYVSNVVEAVRVAESRRPGLIVLEGSGAAVPPVRWHAGVLVAPGSPGRGPLRGSIGAVFRVLLSDLVVLTMGSGPKTGPPDSSDLASHVRSLSPGARIVAIELVPVPLSDVEGKRVYFTTTAPQVAVPGLARSLEGHGCSVVGSSGRLGDRLGLAEDLDRAPAYDVLCTELKAAAIDVAAAKAKERGAEVVFVDNRARTVAGDGDLPELLEDVAGLAVSRAGER